MLKETQSSVLFHGHVIILFLHKIMLQIFPSFCTLRSQTLVIATNNEPRWQEVIIKFPMLDEHLALSDHLGYIVFILLSI